MGTLFSKSNEMPQFGHLKTQQQKSDVLTSSGMQLSAEEQELNTKILEIIDANFKAGVDEWVALKQDQDDIKQSNGAFPSQITDNIFIGDHRAASNARIYDKDSIGISVVINCAGSEFLKKYPPNVKVLKICASDDVNYRIIDKHIGDIIGFLDNVSEKDRKILFHCLAGVNRSVTLCIAYIMNKYKDEQSLADIVDLVSKQRHIGILSNIGFVKQLVQFNSKLHGK